MKNIFIEYIISNNSSRISKKLYKIDNIGDFLDFFSSKNNVFLEILEKFGKIITHIGEDYENNRKKIYISLYDFDFKKSLQIIFGIKNILGIKERYFLEKNFVKFDCLGIDVFEDGKMELKIYEIIKSENFEGLPDFLDFQNIKEIGFLKDFKGRKKKFFRFQNYENIEKFMYIFNISEILNNSESQGKVKYFCVEGEKKEIYFL